MAYASKAGRAHASAQRPRAFAVCDRCGIWFNHHKLRFQFDFAGTNLVNKRILVCSPCLDKPQHQLRAIILPADPIPILNARPEPYTMALSDVRWTSEPATQRHGIAIPHGAIRTTQAGDRRVVQQTGEPPGGLNQQPGTDPAAPGNDDPGLPPGNDEVPKTGPL